MSLRYRYVYVSVKNHGSQKYLYCKSIANNITRLQKLAPMPGKIEVHEFNYRGENQVVYEHNGVKVRSFPAIHSGDGSISYALKWKGFKLVFGGDTFPNKWFIKYSKDADLAVHECFHLPGQMV